MVKAEQDAKNLIATLDIKRILDMFEMTETMDDPSVSIMRGWYMDEIAALLKEHGVSKVYCVTLACGSGV